MHIDEKFVKACKQNDRHAQRQLYEYCFKTLMPICLRYHNNEEDARSSLHLAFLKINNSMGDLNLENLNFRAWIKRITTNTLIDEYRKNKKYQTHYNLKETERELDVLSSPDENEASSNFGCDSILQLMKELPPVSAHVFNLYVIDGYSHKEIAELLGFSDGTSKWHLSTARKLLREKLEKLEAFSPKKLVI